MYIYIYIHIHIHIHTVGPPGGPARSAGIHPKNTINKHSNVGRHCPSIGYWPRSILAIGYWPGRMGLCTLAASWHQQTDTRQRGLQWEGGAVDGGCSM